MTTDGEVGDVDGMRERARQLLTQADRVMWAVGRARSELDRAEYQGPAASRQRATMHDISGRAGVAALGLRELADQLLRSAYSLEQGP